ncbi:hypothetical protein H0R92_05565 [Treponema sp. OMZ 840]|uniref:NADase-type glycan-binding domain-containing protein n=1 Tax=Treponema sp. OMZ 840 TaxID=244313 RepID=UPI003D92958D
MRKNVLLIVLVFCSFAYVYSFTKIVLGEEDESILYYNDNELYFVLPYLKEYVKLDRRMLAVDNDGFLKFTYKNKKLLIIDGEKKQQFFSSFQHDGENTYSDDEDGFHNYNLKNIQASSSFSEIIKGKKINYTPDNLFKCFYIGCKCHPYWWNSSHIPWVEGAPGNGIGESVTIEFKTRIHGISILNGYTDINNMKLYKENSRAKRLKIEDLDNGTEFFADFEDKVYFNFIDFPQSTQRIKITIAEVYKGTKYTDTCISAIIEEEGEKTEESFDRNAYFAKQLAGYISESVPKDADTVLSKYFSGANLFGF